MSKRITLSHSVGELVFLRTDPDQLPRLITRIGITEAGAEYRVSHSDKEPTWHQACEIAREQKKKPITGFKTTQ